ncbi:MULTISPECIES: hypothetical protein [unclassified Paenibacillus]|uniref:hypothetical protein n=1 Tax=unclassified Paenibacillus TaxID=185978 RepID=UPI001AE63498|nr:MULTISPECIES: hypothetical protein [unclassified Paenibacillus]MBP1153949.1 hypothetical protein [Paenibacillus sp. PvP091]MBP1170666.1 hypothetical protein [Paenibacillus sp. PvR098]MBP2441694.1 hypothetical protein [Paenibacillus sp. PvP052]
MGNRNRLSISFKKEHQHIYDHLQSIPNKSHFIMSALELFLRRGGGNTAISHEEVRKIVTDILREQNISSPAISPPPLNLISEEDADFISQLF